MPERGVLVEWTLFERSKGGRAMNEPTIETLARRLDRGKHLGR